MTALDASSDSDDIKPTPTTAPVPSTSQGVPRNRNNAPKRARSSPWCCAVLWTVLIVGFAYIALYWTDPEQVAMRQRAWEATMRKLTIEKTVVHASRWVRTWRFHSLLLLRMLLLCTLQFDRRSHTLFKND